MNKRKHLDFFEFYYSLKRFQPTTVGHGTPPLIFLVKHFPRSTLNQNTFSTLSLNLTVKFFLIVLIIMDSVVKQVSRYIMFPSLILFGKSHLVLLISFLLFLSTMIQLQNPFKKPFLVSRNVIT